MPRVLQTPQAQTDLIEIWVYIAQDNLESADQFLTLLDDKCHGLARNPEMGRARAEVGEGLRSFPVGNYVIFYRPVQDGIDVIRVLHGARDLPSLFD